MAVTLLASVGCGSGVDARASETSSAAATADGSSSAGEGSTTAGDAVSTAPSASSGAEATDGTTSGCLKEITAGPFELVTERSLGLTSLADADVDGELDVVGGRGVVLFSDLSVVALSGPPATNNGRLGRFTDDDVPDMIFASGLPDEALVVFPSIAEGGGPPIATLGESALTFAVGDYDRDGVDDVASGRADGVEVWHGAGDGTFTSLGLVGPDYPSDVTFFSQEDDVRLLITSGFDPTARVYRHEVGTFVLEEMFAQPGVVSVEEVEFFVGQPGHVLMRVWWSLPFGEVDSYVAVVSSQRGRWGGWLYDLHGGDSFDAAMSDIDDAGVGEVAVLQEDADGKPVIAVACLASDRLESCGTVSVPAVPIAVELLSDGPRLLFTTLDEGTWIADLAIAGCE